ncbi:MAG: class I SAM-dependent RNA methyltransferase [Tissierellia bacterium]|nr:class I SAM-dependent RNA methyltransferase [Tissierellia bacterium]
MEYYIEDLTDDGQGVAKVDGKVYFIENGQLGERCEARVLGQKKNITFMEKTKTVEVSPYHVEPRCPHFYECDGCSLQNITYEKELALKKTHIENTLLRIGGEKKWDIPILPGEEYGYRNKVRLQVKGEKLGYYNRKSHHFVPISTCPIAGEVINRNLKAIEQVLQGKDHRIEKIEIRENGKEIQLGVIGKKISPSILNAFRKISDIIEVQMKEKGNYKNFYRKKKFYQTIGNYQYELSQDSFFQVNLMTTKILYDEIKGFVGEGKKILELYCGIGSISIYIAEHNEITGVEIVEKAVQDAKRNARLNDIRNISFLCGKAEDLFRQKDPYKTLVVDPPRAGLHKKLVERIGQSKVQEIIYTSCNPATFARDLKRLKKHGFQLKEITAVDQFSQTLHVECVALIQKI